MSNSFDLLIRTTSATYTHCIGLSQTSAGVGSNYTNQYDVQRPY